MILEVNPVENIQLNNNINKTAVILAGGRSLRMGFDKQGLIINGRYLLEMLVGELSTVFDNIIIISNNPEIYRDMELPETVIITEDMIKGVGPIGGIYTGLMYSTSRYAFFIACDMPHVSLDYIRYQMELIKDNQEISAVLSKKNGYLEPFHGFYSKDLIPSILGNIDQHNLKISEIFKMHKVICVEEHVVNMFSGNLEIFDNLNTTTDLEKLNKRISGL